MSGPCGSKDGYCKADNKSFLINQSPPHNHIVVISHNAELTNLGDICVETEHRNEIY